MFHRKHGHFRSAVSNILATLAHVRFVHELVDHRIGGEFGQALCRFVPFFSNVSTVVSIQNLILMAVDRFEVVVFPLRPPLVRSKLCPFVILATWVIAVAVNSPFLLAYQLLEYSGTKQCVLRWEKEFGKFSSYADYLLALYILFIYISVMLLAILYSINIYYSIPSAIVLSLH